MDQKTPVGVRKQTSAQGLPWLFTGLIAVGAALMVFAVVGLILNNRPQAADGAPVSGPARIGSPLADFTLVDLQGKTVRLSDYEGHLVLINAWATWCPPCRAEMPALQDFYNEHQESGFTILAVNAGETQSQAEGFVQEMGISFPILLDPDEQLMDRLSIHDYPTSILVGRDGLVKAIHIGLLTPEDLEQEILPLFQ